MSDALNRLSAVLMANQTTSVIMLKMLADEISQSLRQHADQYRPESPANELARSLLIQSALAVEGRGPATPEALWQVIDGGRSASDRDAPEE